MTADPEYEFALRLGDNCLILAQRLSEWAGRAPVLEEDIALANTALDMTGQARLWLERAGEIEGCGRSADDLAFFRDSAEFRNVLLAEQPNGDFAHTIMRQFFFDAWHAHFLPMLAASPAGRLADIAEKAAKESSYHLARGTGLVIGLGAGTEDSRARMQAAVDDLWPFTGELFAQDETDGALAADGRAPAPGAVRAQWDACVGRAFAAGGLERPADVYMQQGGKSGVHTEHLGYILAEMQFLQRAYPGLSW